MFSWPNLFGSNFRTTGPGQMGTKTNGPQKYESRKMRPGKMKSGQMGPGQMGLDKWAEQMSSNQVSGKRYDEHHIVTFRI